MAELYTGEILGLTQATGEGIHSLAGGHDDCNLHQIQVNPSAVPAAGSLAIWVRSPGAPTGVFAPVEGTIDLTSTDLVKAFVGHAIEIKAVLTGLDADKSVDIYFTGGVAS